MTILLLCPKAYSAATLFLSWVGWVKYSVYHFAGAWMTTPAAIEYVRRVCQ